MDWGPVCGAGGGRQGHPPETRPGPPSKAWNHLSRPIFEALFGSTFLCLSLITLPQMNLCHEHVKKSQTFEEMRLSEVIVIIVFLVYSYYSFCYFPQFSTAILSPQKRAFSEMHPVHTWARTRKKGISAPQHSDARHRTYYNLDGAISPARRLLVHPWASDTQEIAASLAQRNKQSRKGGRPFISGTAPATKRLMDFNAVHLRSRAMTPRLI